MDRVAREQGGAGQEPLNVKNDMALSDGSKYVGRVKRRLVRQSAEQAGCSNLFSRPASLRFLHPLSSLPGRVQGDLVVS